MRRPLLVAAVVFLGVLAFAASAQACSCARTPLSSAMRDADAAIVGKLIEVVPRDRLRADYRYRVQRIYKPGEGIRPDAVVAVRTSRSSAACGLPAQTGRSYGLLLTRAEERWSGALCGMFSPGQLRSSKRGTSCAS